MDAGSIEELFAQTLVGDYEWDQEPRRAVLELQRLGSREVFDYAAAWIRSDDPLRRVRGLDVMAQLGKTIGNPYHSFPEEAFEVVAQALEGECEADPLESAISALGQIGDERAIPLIAAFHRDPNDCIRLRAAIALGRFADTAPAIEALLTLMEDPDGVVRDWATFGLGVQGHQDTAAIRDALCRRLPDEDDCAREEAIVGLARRQDTRVLPKLLEALQQPEISHRIIESAYTMLGMDTDRGEWSGQDYINALRERFGSQG
ncbi:MAG: HEAT repeat domain-containing protein [Bryobacterales bacterium]|nr:HEAT repeat domain-containing protein [Bryobacterales bacterium]